jgi:hypothetical protein
MSSQILYLIAAHNMQDQPGQHTLDSGNEFPSPATMPGAMGGPIGTSGKRQQG